MVNDRRTEADGGGIIKFRRKINPEGLEKHITPRTKVIAPVDFAGHPADLDAVSDIARKNELIVVEDAAHALGAAYICRYTGIRIIKSWVTQKVFTRLLRIII